MTFNLNNTNTKITPLRNFLSVNEGCYKLHINHQHSLQKEQFAENGLQKSVHYVVKNSAFVLEVGLIKSEKRAPNCSSFINNSNTLLMKGSEQFDFNRITLEASLYYDCPEEKEVACVRVVPVSYRGFTTSGNPNTYKLEVIIKVLSSQHEDMNFKLKLVAVDSKTKQPIHEILPIFSHPIQVISKPEVLQKKNQPKAPKGKKKTKSEMILETLARIENEQRQQSLRLDAIGAEPKAQRLSGHKRSVLAITSEDSVEPISFETAYFQFVAACQRVSRDELPAKIRKVTQNSSDSELSAISRVCSMINPDSQRAPNATSALQSSQIASPPPLITTDFLSSDISQFDDLMQVLGLKQ